MFQRKMYTALVVFCEKNSTHRDQQTQLRRSNMKAILEEGCEGFGLLYQDDQVSVWYVLIHIPKRLGLAWLCPLRARMGILSPCCDRRVML